MSDPRWLDPTELRAWRGLSLAQLQLQARLGAELAEHDLSYQDYLVLASLSDRVEGRSRIVELSHELGWEKSRISHHLSKMCERGLVAKERCPTDQRGTYVVITAAGRAAQSAAAADHVASVRRLFIDLLSRAQIETLADVAEVVLARLGATD